MRAVSTRQGTAVSAAKRAFFPQYRPGTSLNIGRFAAYVDGPTKQRKEVIQCLVSSAVTSLGSPAKRVFCLARGALSAWTSEFTSGSAAGVLSAAFFLAPGRARSRPRPPDL